MFSEIEGRENSELDLCESAVHRLVFPGSGYENDLGGSTAGIASVTREDLLAYHKRFYRAEAMTVLIFGCSDHEGVFRRH